MDGENRVDVLLSKAMIIMCVSDTEVLLADGFWDFPKGCVSVDRLGVEGRLAVLEVKTAASDQGKGLGSSLFRVGSPLIA